MISCPNCGSNPRFDIESQQLKCPNCGSFFDPATFPEETGGADMQTVTGDYAGQPDMMQVRIYTCSQCGGELMSTDTDATAFCSYCGSHQVLEERLSSQKRPRHIIPFKITKEDCKKAYAAKLRRSLFAPGELKDPAYIDEFRGIYMPYWYYDFEQKGDITLSGTREHRSGNYRIIDHYALSVEADNFYGGISHDASSSMDDTISESLAPYDIKESLKFRTPYISGFYADIPDVGEETYQNESAVMVAEDAVHRAKAFREFNGYSIKEDDDKKVVHKTNTNLVQATAAMLPVWFLAFRKDDRVAYAAINGQTGKITADVPIDPRKYLAAVGVLTVVIWLALQTFNVSSLRTIVLINIFAAMLGGLTYGMAIYKLRDNILRRKWEKSRGTGAVPEPKEDLSGLSADEKKERRKKIKEEKKAIEGVRKSSVPGLGFILAFIGILIVVALVLAFFGFSALIAIEPFIVAAYVSIGFSETGLKRGIISNWVLAAVTAVSFPFSLPPPCCN